MTPPLGSDSKTFSSYCQGSLTSTFWILVGNFAAQDKWNLYFNCAADM